MAIEDKVVERTAEREPGEAPERKRGAVHRRTFLKGLGGVATGAAVLSKIDLAHAENSWMSGIADVPEDKLVGFYTTMLKSRWWEEKLKDEFLRGDDELYGAFHIYIGEEAIATGAIGALNEDDYIASTHRGHGHLIAKGGDINKMTAEIYFRATGYNNAHGGSMHITDVSKGILGMNGIIGPSYLLSAGAAYGIKVRGTSQVAMAFGGDGSLNNGWFWSAFRNAALYKLPLIGVIENNGWQISMPTANTIGIEDLSQAVAGLEIPNETVDGTDVLAVYSVAKRAVERARAGEGPTLIEAKAPRFYDHAGLAGAEIGRLGAFGLPYRSDRDVHASIANDPIPKFRRFLLSMNILTEDRAVQIEDEVKGLVDTSIELARAAPLPAQDAGLNHVYAGHRVAATQFIT